MIVGLVCFTLACATSKSKDGNQGVASAEISADAKLLESGATNLVFSKQLSSPGGFIMQEGVVLEPGMTPNYAKDYCEVGYVFGSISGAPNAKEAVVFIKPESEYATGESGKNAVRIGLNGTVTHLARVVCHSPSIAAANQTYGWWKAASGEYFRLTK